MRTLPYSFAALVIIGLISASSLVLTTAQVSTEVSGLINSNMTWTKTSGPYVLVGPVIISNGVTLTIQPGASILLGRYYLLVNGTLRAQGTSTDPILFQNGSNGGFDSRGNPIYPITFTYFSTSWNEAANTGCIIENAKLTSTSIFTTSAPKINNNIFTDSFIGISNFTLSAEPPYPAAPTITNNTMKSTTTYSGIITYNSIGTIANNIISGYTTGVEMHSDAGTKLQNNLITGNTNGIQLFSEKGPVLATITNNTITNNTIGISITKVGNSGTTPTIRYNNIYSNTNNSIYSAVPDNIIAINNWWGTTSTTAISQSIWDFKNNAAAGNVTFSPFLNAANPEAPSPQPTPTPTPTVLPTPTSTNPSTTTPTPSTSTSPPTSSVTPTNTIQPTNSPIQTPPKTPTASPSETPQPTPSPTLGTNNNQGISSLALYAGIIIVVIIIAAAVILTRRKIK